MSVHESRNVVTDAPTGRKLLRRAADQAHPGRRLSCKLVLTPTQASAKKGGAFTVTNRRTSVTNECDERTA